MSVTTPNDTATYRPAEVARILGVSLDTVYEALRSGELPGRKLRGCWIVPRGKFDRWLESRAS